MRKFWIFLVSALLLVSCGNGWWNEVSYRDEPLPNDFDTVIVAHHQEIADSIRDYVEDVYGKSKSVGTTDTNLTVKGQGIDLLFSAKGDSNADLTDPDLPKSESDLDIELVLTADNPIFPTRFELAVDGMLGLITEWQKAYFKISDVMIEMGDQADIANQMMSMVKLFEDKWIVTDPTEDPAYDPDTADLAQNLPEVLEAIADELPNYPIFSLVEAKGEEEDYYIYSVSIDEENIASLAAIVAQRLNPNMEQAEIDQMKQDMVENMSAEDLVGDLRVHKKAPQLWSITASATGEDGSTGTLDIANAADTAHFKVTDSQDGVEIEVQVEKWDADTGTVSLKSNNELIVFGSFRLDVEDMNGTISADLDVHNIPNLTEPLKVSFTSVNQSTEDSSLEIVIPQDAISAADLGLAGIGTPTIGLPQDESEIITETE